MEEDLNSEVEEVTPQDHVQGNETVESSETSEVSSEQTGGHEPESKQEHNWREARRKQREYEIRLKAQEEMIEKLLKAQKSEPQAQAPQEIEEEIDPNDYPTWGQAEKKIYKTAEAIAERKYRELENKKEQSRFVERLKTKYPDFTDIVNPDSIALLEEKDPDLAETIAELKDPYKMGLQTYKYLKAMNVTDEEMGGKRHAKEVEKKLAKNEKAVQSPQAFNKRPMAQAFRLTDSEKSKLYEEMMGYASQGGYGY